jgi:hypothetical protein
MPSVALSGKDTITINGRVLADLADANVSELTFPNEIAALKTGKNGNSVYALNETGRQAELRLRLIRGSSDDKYFNGLIASQQADFAATVLATGQVVKRLGDGLGNILNDTYILSGGIMTKMVDVKSNVEGDTEQSISSYSMKFSNAPRVIT